MTPRLPTTTPFRLPPAQSRLRRLVRSSAFAWAISLVLHGALFGAFWAAALREASPVRRIIIPEARLAASPVSAEPVALHPLGLSPPPVEPTPASPLPRPDETVLSAWATDRERPSLTLPPREPAAPGAPLAARAMSAAAPGPVSRFFGQSGSAYRVVYVVDVSASLMIYIDEIVSELRASIRALLPTQRFHIVLARPRRVEEFAPRRLVPAIEKYKTEADLFLASIDRVPQPGQADPIEAMRRAFAAGPELVYFLSDGDYADVEDDLERELKRLNSGQEVRITTIGFHPPRESKGRPELLERIADGHGGHFRLVEIR